MRTTRSTGCTSSARSTGGDLVGQFHDRGLLDEIILNVAPVTLGAGAPLPPRRITTPPLKLVDVRKHGDVFA